VIVVVGSRHDSTARAIVEALPAAALCAAEDLTRPGWVWSLDFARGKSPAPGDTARWVVDGRIVDDREVTGVYVHRTYVYPEELVTTHQDDREYLAAESTAFLIFVLSRTAARVVNPVADGALGDDAIRPERWMPIAATLGLDPVPLRLRRGRAIDTPVNTVTVEVVGSDAFGDAPPRLRAASITLAAKLGVVHASFVFDTRRRLVAVSGARPPGKAALAALGSVLSGRGGG
jgi:hypothetical protein